MSGNDELTWLDATAQAELVARGKITPAELAEAAIARIERLNPQLNCVIFARYDKARNEGDFDTAAVIAGEGVDMISDIPPAREVVDRMVKEASALLAGSNRYRVA